MRVASAPGKAIISGEYSVLFGAPALTVALQQRLRVRYESDRLPRLSWLAPDRVHELALEKFSTLRHKLDNAFEGYLKGERSISEIITRPAELVFYTVDMARMLGNIREIPRGQVKIESEIPIGAGMGSSAALLAALLSLFAKVDSVDDLIRQVRHCERLQHGKGSLMDAATVCLGGMVKTRGDQASRLDTPTAALEDNLYWIHTGTPITSTGVCVEQVRNRFSDSSIWSEFSEITTAVEASISQKLFPDQLIRDNQKLLNRIGVVPATVAALIEQIEQRGGAAKVSGAGAVAGDAGGLVILWLPEGTPDQLHLPVHFRWGKLQISNQGVQIED